MTDECHLLPCRKCGEEKPPESFYRSKARKTGRDSYCKACRNAVNKEWKKNASGEMKDRIRKRRRAWERRNPEKHAARNLKWLAGLDEAAKQAIRDYKAAWNRADRAKKKAAAQGEVPT